MYTTQYSVKAAFASHTTAAQLVCAGARLFAASTQAVLQIFLGQITGGRWELAGTHTVNHNCLLSPETS